MSCETYYECFNCGRRFPAEGVFPSNTYSKLCLLCAFKEGRLIQEYDSNPDFKIHRSVKDDGIYLGIEIELGGLEDEQEADLAALAVYRTGKGFLWCKADCSISGYGFEVVSHPANLEYHLNKVAWETVLGDCHASGMSDAVEGALPHGLHIHVNRESLFTRQWAMLDAFVNNFSDFFRKVSYGGCEEYAEFKDGEALCTPEPWHEKYAKYADDRFVSVNFSHANTVELRFWRASFNYNDFKLSLELTHALVRFFQKGADVCDPEAFTKFSEFVKASYPETWDVADSKDAWKSATPVCGTVQWQEAELA